MFLKYITTIYSLYWWVPVPVLRTKDGGTEYPYYWEYFSSESTSELRVLSQYWEYLSTESTSVLRVPQYWEYPASQLPVFVPQSSVLSTEYLSTESTPVLRVPQYREYLSIISTLSTLSTQCIVTEDSVLSTECIVTEDAKHQICGNLSTKICGTLSTQIGPMHYVNQNRHKTYSPLWCQAHPRPCYRLQDLYSQGGITIHHNFLSFYHSTMSCQAGSLTASAVYT